MIFDKIRTYYPIMKNLYSKKWFRYFLFILFGVFLVFTGILIEHYRIRRNIPLIIPPAPRHADALIARYDAKLLVDEKVFLEKIKDLFDAKTVFDTYRQGLHSFKLTVFVDPNNKVIDHFFKRWDGSNYITANNFIDSLKFHQVLNAIPFSNGCYDIRNDYNGMKEFNLRIGINKDGKLIQPLEIYDQEKRWSAFPLGKYITKNDIMNRTGVYVDLNNDEISQYTYKRKDAKPDTPPVPINHQKVFDEKLAYPEKAKEMELQGRVALKVLVNEAGNVVAVSIEKGLGGGCDEAAVKAAFDVKYKPALINGKPTKSSAILPVIFKL